jgi:16S rRNA (cytidine1402-2'-O)-methyltransferase
MEMGTLYLVATPIGNLEDITLRALRVLREVGLVAAEDTRHTRKLLARYEIETPVTSYYEHNKLTKLDSILDALKTGDVALVSDAGMPGLSDPGYELVRACLERGVPMVPVPGPSAVVTALVASGLPTDQFLYLGFLPRRAGARRALLASVARERATLVCFEAPHRLLAALGDLGVALGNRPVTVARELTKLHEEIWRGTLEEALVHFRTNPPRGEFTLVVGGAPVTEERWDEAQVQSALEEVLAQGASTRTASQEVALLAGWPRREVYALALQVRRLNE